MNYEYVAYNRDRKLIKGKLSASSEDAAGSMLSSNGYQLVSLKAVVPLFSLGKYFVSAPTVKLKEVIMFSRQLALLLSSGIDVVTALELLKDQLTNPTLRNVIAEIVADIRGGISLSQAMAKHPKIFPSMYWRAMGAGEQAGSMEQVLRQMAEYLERTAATIKKVKGALTYPIVVSVVAVVVVGLMITVVLPTFTTLYTQMGAKMPAAAQALLDFGDWFKKNILYVILLVVAGVVAGMAYIKTPKGQFRYESLLLRAPIIGRIIILVELSRACRTIALLFRVGLPLPEIMTMVAQGSSNKAMLKALSEVHEELIRGEGLSKPMANRAGFFLPLMVQMVSVGEETGHLDSTLSTVAESFDVEANDRIDAAVGLITPAITVVIGAVVAGIAVVMMSAMYSIYSQMSPG
ncbi:MAG: pilC [Dehalococcoidales bacterium]|nr:pilC [Dehalococcoidales bacterium]